LKSKEKPEKIFLIAINFHYFQNHDAGISQTSKSFSDFLYHLFHEEHLWKIQRHKMQMPLKTKFSTHFAPTSPTFF